MLFFLLELNLSDSQNSLFFFCFYSYILRRPLPYCGCAMGHVNLSSLTRKLNSCRLPWTMQSLNRWLTREVSQVPLLLLLLYSLEGGTKLKLVCCAHRR